MKSNICGLRQSNAKESKNKIPSPKSLLQRKYAAVRKAAAPVKLAARRESSLIPNSFTKNLARKVNKTWLLGSNISK